MKKLSKIVFFSVLGFFLFGIIVAIGIYIFVPADELENIPTETHTPEQEHKPEPLPEPKELVWDKTPAEQGLKVGDWIITQAERGSYIGAMAILKDDKNHNISNYNLYNIDPQTGDYFMKAIGNEGIQLQVFELKYSENSFFDIAKNPRTPNHKISLVGVKGLSNHSQSPVVRQYNLLKLHEQGDITGLIVSGQITEISTPYTREGATRQSILIDYKEESTLQLTATEAEITQAMESAKAKATVVKQEFLQLAGQFLAGKHLNTAEYIKERLNNPKSFEHVRTNIFQTNKKERYRIIQMTYRGTNLYNAIVTNTVRVKVDLQGTVIGVIK